MALNSLNTTNIADDVLFNTTDGSMITRTPIPEEPDNVYVESCLVSSADSNIVLAVILTYGLILTAHLMLKGMRTFHKYNMQNETYVKMLFCDRIGFFFGDFLNKRNIYIILFLHIWNQATDIGVIVEMYYLSFSVCTIEFTLLYRLFGAGLAFMLFYRFTTAIFVIYATQQPSHFFYQLTDLLLIKNLELNYTFDLKSIDEVQLWIIYCGCCFQSFAIMLMSVGIMTLTQGYAEHPFLLLSFILSFILFVYAIISNDRIIYKPFAHILQFDKDEILNIKFSNKLRDIVTGYCCYCEGFRIEYIYRISFRFFDFQFRIFILNFIWTATGGVYLALYLFIEFLVLYLKARNIGRYQLLSGLIGVVINYTSTEAKKFCNRFAWYRFITNYLLLILVYCAVTIDFDIPISDPFERRRADFTNLSYPLYFYFCGVSVLLPWLYFGCIKGGELIRNDDDASTNPTDPHSLIANKDFPRFLQLIVFGNKFYKGNEWVLQGLLNAIEDNIFRIPPKYLILLLSSYKWDFTKISYYTKSKFFASIMRFNDIQLSKLLFNKFTDCNDITGVEAGLLYWCQSKNLKADNLTFLRLIKLIQSKFNMRKLNVLVQSQLLKYTILRAAKLGDVIPFHSILAYNLNDATLSHLYLHYTDFSDCEEHFTKKIFADILHTLLHVRNFKFNMDNNTAKCFLFWSLKFESWETINESLLHSHASKQVYSKYTNDNMSFLHLVCKKPCDYKSETGQIISENICKIADVCINALYTPLNEHTNKKGVTTLMHACEMLHIPLIKTLLKYGPRLNVTNANNNDCKWYIEHNYFIKKNKIQNIQSYGQSSDIYNGEEEEKEQKNNETKPHSSGVYITFEEMEIRKKIALDLLNNSSKTTVKEEEFIELYEERYDEFVVENESIPLYRSFNNDLNSLFESIIKLDFQRIINLIDNHTLDPNIPTIDGTTPLHFACQHSGALIIKFLMDRGAFPFMIKNNQMFPIEMLDKNERLDEAEKEFMKRLLNVKDVDHDPFALTDERVVEIERIQSFAHIFVKYLLILFAVFVVTFATSAGLTDRFKIGYISPL